MEIGSLPLNLDLLESALSPAAMDILEPPAVSVSFTASRAANSGGGGLKGRGEQLLLAAGEDDGHGQQRQGAIWGHIVAVGEPLQLSMQVRALSSAYPRVAANNTLRASIWRVTVP